MNTGRPGAGDSFTALEAQMDELEAQGVPDEWATAFRRLRSELKNVRGRWSPYEQAFAPLDEDSADQFLQAAKAWGEGRTDAVARWMFEVSKHATEPATWNEWLGAEGAPAEPGEKPAELEEQDMDPEQIKSIVAEAVAEAMKAQAAETAQEREAREFREKVETKLRDLGYEDPSSPAAAAVLLTAKDIDGDPFDAIDQAHTQFQSYVLERAKSYTAEKSADAGTTDPLVGDGNGESDELDGFKPDPGESDPEKLMAARMDAAFGPSDPSVLT